MALLERFPFLTLLQALLLMRVTVAGLFLAHAVVRIIDETTPQFAVFMESQGFSHGLTWVWAITLLELAAGSAMALGRGVRWASSGLFIIAAGGIVLIHRQFGWFVGEHGTGGCEYSVALMVMLMVLAAADRPPNRPLTDIGSSG